MVADVEEVPVDPEALEALAGFLELHPHYDQAEVDALFVDAYQRGRASVPVERVELFHLCGRLVDALDYLRQSARLRGLEGSPSAPVIRAMADKVSHVRERLRDIGERLPEGQLEAFGRLHPLHDDPLDGPYCGYGAKDGKPYSCPVRDPALHWDAWELLGTRLKRPPQAVRPSP